MQKIINKVQEVINQIDQDKIQEFIDFTNHLGDKKGISLELTIDNFELSVVLSFYQENLTVEDIYDVFLSDVSDKISIVEIEQVLSILVKLITELGDKVMEQVGTLFFNIVQRHDAAIKFNQFEAYLDVGFTRQEALELLIKSNNVLDSLLTFLEEHTV